MQLAKKQVRLYFSLFFPDFFFFFLGKADPELDLCVSSLAAKETSWIKIRGLTTFHQE